MEGSIGRESPLFFKIFLQMCSEMLHPGEMLIPANHMEEIGLIQSIHLDNDFTDVVNSIAESVRIDVKPFPEIRTNSILMMSKPNLSLASTASNCPSSDERQSIYSSPYGEYR